MRLRIASYNVENLFRRAKVLNLNDPGLTDKLLGKIRAFQALLNKTVYTPQIKNEIFTASIELQPYIEIRKDAGSLGDWKREPAVTGPTGYRINNGTKGRGDWIGEIVFSNAEFSDQQRKNTGKVIKALNADILCAVEVEGMDVLRQFNSQVLGSKKFAQYVMIDSPNDPRGIDVACLTKHKILSVRSHVFDDGVEFKPVFSRDCLEVAIDVGLTKPIYVLCNHFKSQSGKTQADKDKSARKRVEQSAKVIEIIKTTYDLTKDYVVVLGDLNEETTNAYKSLDTLFSVPNLTPVFDPLWPATQRYTYFFEGAKPGEKLNQLDYIFLSKPLTQAITASGFERRGIFGVDKFSVANGAMKVTPFAEVASWDLSASDHAGIWVEVDL
jgi:endonuclease/exonuclease/phosphatase family metal-dependent hydrolase